MNRSELCLLLCAATAVACAKPEPPEDLLYERTPEAESEAPVVAEPAAVETTDLRELFTADLAPHRNPYANPFLRPVGMERRLYGPEIEAVVPTGPVLQGIFRGEASRSAVISGTTVREGDRWEDWQVLVIEDKHVVLIRGEERRELQL